MPGAVSRLRQRVGLALVLLPLLLWALSLGAGYEVVTDVHPALASLRPQSDHLLGTDHLGRDVFWRWVTASESFVGPGLLACAVALLLGLPGGAISGYLGGPGASAIRLAFASAAALPRFVLVLLACAAFGSEVGILAIAAGVAYAPTLAEALYTRLESFRHAGFVLAARAHGLSHLRVLLHHLLWVNCRRLLLRHALMLFAYFLLLETTLSYIGGLDGAGSFGVAEPQPSWGNMIAFEWRQPESNPWASLAPALATFAVLLGASWVSDDLKERA